MGGWLGLTTRTTLDILECSRGGNQPIDIEHVPDIYQQKIDELLKKDPEINYIIALTHQTLEDDRILAKNAKNLNLILGGHEHEIYTEVHNDIHLLKAGMDAEHCCIVEIRVNKDMELKTTYEVVDIQTYPG